jgi:hypothetical protein
VASQSREWRVRPAFGSLANSYDPDCDSSARRTTNPPIAHAVIRSTYDTGLNYSLLYFFLTMPLVVSRIAEFTGHEWSLTFAYVGAAILDCSGLANVLLYTITRKGITKWSWFKRGRSTAPPQFETHNTSGHWHRLNVPQTQSPLSATH